MVLKNKRYCCYRHFIEGKSAKDSTYCYSHVPLGIINPSHKSKTRDPAFMTGNLEVETKAFRIQNRTHDYNEIQHKNSLPNRLIKPKVYIENMIPKGSINTFSLQSTRRPLVKSRFYQSQYDTLFNFFKKIAAKLQTVSKSELKDTIISFMVKNQLNIKDKNMLLNKKHFKLLLNLQFDYEEGETQQFWEIAFNDRRFKSTKYTTKFSNGQSTIDDYVSMSALIHNFDKFYIQQTQNFVNMLSETALKQRVIDIRHFLYDWYVKNINYKINMRLQNQKEFQICQYLRRFSGEDTQIDSDSLYSQMMTLIEKRNLEYQKLRIIAKFLYSLTDNKFLSFDKIRDNVIRKIQIESQFLYETQKILKNFMEIKEYESQEKFVMTEIFQFMKLEDCHEKQFQFMTKYMRRLLKYIYFNKNTDGDHGIFFSVATLSFTCNKLIQITPKLIAQFSIYLKDHTHFIIKILEEGFMKYLEETMVVIETKIESSNMKNEAKIKILQCNYISEGIKRYLIRSNFVDFWVLNTLTSIDNYMGILGEGKISIISDILSQAVKKSSDSVGVKKSIKNMFNLNQPPYSEHPSLDSENVEGSDKLKDAFINYKNNGDKTDELKLILKENKTNQEEGNKQLQIFKFDPKNQVNQKVDPSYSDKNGQNNFVQHACMKITCPNKQCCSRVSVKTMESISAVENLESKLFDILNL